jgi:hypothetical protein
MTKTVFGGDQEIVEATSCLKSSVESYNRAIDSAHFRVGIKTYELVKGKVPFESTVVNYGSYERSQN